jgi:hypothetical protein
MSSADDSGSGSDPDPVATKTPSPSSSESENAGESSPEPLGFSTLQTKSKSSSRSPDPKQTGITHWYDQQQQVGQNQGSKSRVWQVVFDRVREILRRDDLKQKALAERVEMSGSTLSLMLQNKYKHTREKHITRLKEWVRFQDYQYVANVKHFVMANQLKDQNVADQIGVSSAVWRSWLDFSMPVPERNKIDLALKRLFGIQRSQMEYLPQLAACELVRL